MLRARHIAPCVCVSVAWMALIPLLASRWGEGGRPPPGRSVGRPTLDKAYRDHLYALISSNSLPEGVSPVRPPWWRPGMDIIGKRDKIIDEGAASYSVPSRDALASTLVGGDTEAVEDFQ
eukprot:4374095-Amphidinium_carterae.1